MKICMCIFLGVLGFSSLAWGTERSLDEIRAASYSFPEMVAARNFLEINPNEEAIWLNELAAKNASKRKASKKISLKTKNSSKLANANPKGPEAVASKVSTPAQFKVPVQQDIAQAVTPEQKAPVVIPQKTIQVPDKES